jgi:hypothetical protein
MTMTERDFVESQHDERETSGRSIIWKPLARFLGDPAKSLSRNPDFERPGITLHSLRGSP